MAILEPLSYKQQKFCEEYLLSFNAYRAALTAGYTDNTARKGDLLHVPKIQGYLKQAMTRSAARAELTHDMLLRELMKIAFCNMGNYYDDQGNPKRMHQLTDEEKAAMSYFHREDVMTDNGYITGEVFKIKLYNKMAAIDRLCKHTGFYKAQWKPDEVQDRSETAEDIAFEAKCAETPAGPYSEEVQDELIAQTLSNFAGLSGRQGSSIPDLENKVESETQEGAGLPDVQPGQSSNCSTGSTEEDSYEEDDVDLMWELGRQVDARAALMKDGKGKTEDVVENILTFSPLREESQVEKGLTTHVISAKGRKLTGQDEPGDGREEKASLRYAHSR